LTTGLQVGNLPHKSTNRHSSPKRLSTPWSRGKLIALGFCAAILLALALSKALSIAFSIASANRTAAATTSASIDIDGRTRTYLLHTPPGYDRHRRTALVLVLHGATQSPDGAERMSGMSALADREKFLVAYPGGTGRLSRVPTWNAGNCCGYALTHKVDDVAFIRALIDKLEHDYPVDPKRVYIAGISNGAMMSYRLACELSDKIAAITPVEGAQNVIANRRTLCRSSSSLAPPIAWRRSMEAVRHFSSGAFGRMVSLPGR
jgi:polyhydroxybutyrate depolymerase